MGFLWCRGLVPRHHLRGDAMSLVVAGGYLRRYVLVVDGWLMGVGMALDATRSVFAGGSTSTGKQPQFGGRFAADWGGASADQENEQAEDIDHETADIGEVSRALDEWSRQLAADSAAGRSSADRIRDGADAAARALGSAAADNPAAKAALVRSMNAHLDAAGNLVNSHAGTVSARQQALLALLNRGKAGSGADTLSQLFSRGSGSGGGGASPSSGAGGGGFSPPQMSAPQMPDLGSLLTGAGHGGGGSGGGAGSMSSAGYSSPIIGGPSQFENLDAKQMDVAKAIVAEGVRRRLPPQAMQIALATALQESGLRSLANPAVPASMMLPHDGVGRDHDSVGPFQQRQTWGRTVDLMNPAASAGKFYDQLEKLQGWQKMPVTVAAQQVQRSAFPDAYAKHTRQAGALVNVILGGGQA